MDRIVTGVAGELPGYVVVGARADPAGGRDIQTFAGQSIFVALKKILEIATTCFVGSSVQETDPGHGGMSGLSGLIRLLSFSSQWGFAGNHARCLAREASRIACAAGIQTVLAPNSPTLYTPRGSSVEILPSI